MDAAAADLAFLYRRAGFGARPDDLADAVKQGYEATVNEWVEGLARPDPTASQVPVPELISLSDAILAHGYREKTAVDAKAYTQWAPLMQWWMARKVAAQNPLTEKLTLLMQNLFPTGISKVLFPKQMLVQDNMFRASGWGRFDDLVLQVASDPAMLIWLDAIQQESIMPNENFARELMERFTMGVGNYTQRDVVAGAVCFSGIDYDPYTERPIVVRANRVPQTFLGHTGVTLPAQIVKFVTHSQASHRYVPSRLWSWLAWPVQPGDPVLAQVTEQYQSDLSMANLLRNIFLHPEFRSSKAVTGLVKQPIEYAAGVLRALNFSPRAIAAGEPSLYTPLAGMGQIPFDPPSVGGWGQNEAWLSSAAVLARWRFSTAIVAHQSADLSAVVDSPPRGRPDVAANLLSVTSWSMPTHRALARLAGNPQAMMSLALISPEYVNN